MTEKKLQTAIYFEYGLEIKLPTPITVEEAKELMDDFKNIDKSFLDIELGADNIPFAVIPKNKILAIKFF